MFRKKQRNGKLSDKACREWEYYLIKGNEYYFRGQYQPAAYCYSIAADYLEVIVDKESSIKCCESCNDERCFQHYFIACQNTSHAFSKSGDLVKAEHYLSRAHYKFLALVTNSTDGSLSWQQAMHAICERSLDCLVQFLERHDRKGAAISIMVESRRLLGD